MHFDTDKREGRLAVTQDLICGNPSRRGAASEARQDL